MAEFETIKMLGDRVCVALDQRKTDAEGIVIPQIAKLPAFWGVAGAVGPECKHVRQGDRVYVSRHVGNHFKKGQYEYVILHEGQILCREEV